jgi:hypothetical protein
MGQVDQVLGNQVAPASSKHDWENEMNILEEIRVNRAPTHMVRPAGLELQKKTKQTLGPYVERKKLPGEVKAAENDLWQRGYYKTGDGDYTAQVPRAGSLRAFSLPSKGNKT